MKLDAVELRTAVGFQSTEPDYLMHVKLMCLKFGLPIGYLGSVGGFVGPDESVRERISRAKKDADIAAFMGIPMIRVFGGTEPEGTTDREPLFHQLVSSLQEVSDYAMEKGICVGLQNHNNKNLAATGDDVLRILKDTDRDNFSLIMDTGQWRGSKAADPVGTPEPSESSYAYIAQTAPYAACVRAKIYKIDSGIEEWIDYKRVINILRAINYNGTMSIVFEGLDYNRCDDKESLHLAVRHIRELLRR